jgi:hypothetical protein
MGRSVLGGALSLAVCVALAAIPSMSVAKASRSDAITGSDAIVGSDAITGSDRLKQRRGSAITGSDAIVGSDAITGSDRLKQRRGSAITGSDAIVGFDPYAVYDRKVILAGPASIKTDGTVEMFGREFKVRDGRAGLASPDGMAAGQPLTALVVGGPDRSGKVRAERISIARTPYVDGVTQVLVSGRISSSRPDRATLHIGKIAVDYSNLLADGAFEVSVGDHVSVVGVRPSADAAIQAIGLRLHKVQ